MLNVIYLLRQAEKGIIYIIVLESAGTHFKKVRVVELISKRCSSKPGLRRFFALIIFLILPVLLESKFDHGTFQVLRL